MIYAALQALIADFQKQYGVAPSEISMHRDDEIELGYEITGSGSQFPPNTLDVHGVPVLSHKGKSQGWATACRWPHTCAHMLPTHSKVTMPAQTSNPGYTIPVPGTYQVQYNVLYATDTHKPVPTITHPKCECGSSVVGSSRHSSWCPQHEAA